MDEAGRHFTHRSGAVATAFACALLFGGLVLGARQLRLDSPQSHHAKSLLKLDSALGATLEPLDARAARALGGGIHEEEMVVTSIAAGGRAEAAGLRVGDVVEEVDGKDPADLDAALDAVSTDPTEILVNRHGSRATLKISAQNGALHA